MKKINIIFSFLISILVFGVGLEFAQVPMLTQEYDEALARVNATLGFEIDSVHSSFINFTDYYDLGNQSIFIKDDDPDYNWSKTAAENPWCSGSGNESDPYIIENVFIDGKYHLERVLYPDDRYKDYSAINIHNSHAFFEIRNCYINRSGKTEFEKGIFIHNTTNGLIRENIINYCVTGVALDIDSGGNSDITIQKNIFIHNFVVVYGGAGACRAIHVDGAHDILVEQNFIQDYSMCIYTLRSSNVMVRKNFVNTTLFEYVVPVGLEFSRVVECSVVENVLAGDFAYENFTVDMINCTGLSVHNNSVVGSLPDFVTSIMPHISTTSNSILFDTAIGGSITNNMMYIPQDIPQDFDTPDFAIPGYDIGFIAISFIAVVCVVALLMRNKMRFKK